MTVYCCHGERKHPPFWVRPKHCIFFPSLVNKTVESTGKPRSQHFSTQLNLGLERLRLGEQHNPKKTSLHHPRKAGPWQLCRPSKLPGGRSTAWKKTPTPCKGQAASQHCCCWGRQIWGSQGQHDARGTQLRFPWSYMGRPCLNGNTHLARSLCVSLAILAFLPSLVKWWLLGGKRRQSTYLDSAFPPWGFLHRSSWPEYCLCSSSHKKNHTPPLSPPKIPQKSQDKFIMGTLTQP